MGPNEARFGTLSLRHPCGKFVDTPEPNRNASLTSLSPGKQRLRNAAAPRPSCRISPKRNPTRIERKHHPVSFQPSFAMALLPSGTPLTTCKRGPVAERLWEYLVPVLIPAPRFARPPDTAPAPYLPAPHREDWRCQFSLWRPARPHCLPRWKFRNQDSSSRGPAGFRFAPGSTLCFLPRLLLSSGRIPRSGLPRCLRQPWNPEPGCAPQADLRIGHTTRVPEPQCTGIFLSAMHAMCSNQKKGDHRRFLHKRSAANSNRWVGSRHWP